MHKKFQELNPNTISTFFALFCRPFVSPQYMQDFENLPTVQCPNEGETVECIPKTSLNELILQYKQLELNFLTQLTQVMRYSPKTIYHPIYQNIISYFTYEDTMLVEINNSYLIHSELHPQLTSALERCFPELYPADNPINLNALIIQNESQQIFYLVNKNNPTHILGFIMLQNSGIPFDQYKPGMQLSDKNFEIATQSIPNAISIWTVCTTNLGNLYNNICKTMISKLLELIPTHVRPIELVVKTNNDPAIGCYENFNFRKLTVNESYGPVDVEYKHANFQGLSFYVMRREPKERTELEKTSDESVGIYFREILKHMKNTDIFKTLSIQCRKIDYYKLMTDL